MSRPAAAEAGHSTGRADLPPAPWRRRHSFAQIYSYFCQATVIPVPSWRSKKGGPLGCPLSCTRSFREWTPMYQNNLHVLPQAKLDYIPASRHCEPAIRAILFRKNGSAILDFPLSTLRRICDPASEQREHMLAAFREALPDVLQTLNGIVVRVPAGGALVVSAEMLRTKASGDK